MSLKRKVDSIVELKEKNQKITELEQRNQELEQQVTDLQIALCEVYETMIGGAN
jgi:prefoldin subunit 5